MLDPENSNSGKEDKSNEIDESIPEVRRTSDSKVLLPEDLIPIIERNDIPQDAKDVIIETFP